MVQFSPVVLDTPEDVSCRYQLNGLEKHPTENAPARSALRRVATGKFTSSGCSANRRMRRIIRRRRVFISGCCRMCGNPVGSGGFGGCGVNGRHLGFRFAANANAEPAKKSETGAGGGGQRSAELLQKNKGIGTDLADRSIDGYAEPALFLRNDPPRMKRKRLRSHQRFWRWRRRRVRRPRELIFVLVDIDRFQARERRDGPRSRRQAAAGSGEAHRIRDAGVRTTWCDGVGKSSCWFAGRRTARMRGCYARRVLEAVRDLPFDVGNGVQLHKTCSIGWAPYPWMPGDSQMLSIDNVIELADKALVPGEARGTQPELWTGAGTDREDFRKEHFDRKPAAIARRSWCRSSDSQFFPFQLMSQAFLSLRLG